MSEFQIFDVDAIDLELVEKHSEMSPCDEFKVSVYFSVFPDKKAHQSVDVMVSICRGAVISTELDMLSRDQVEDGCLTRVSTFQWELVRAAAAKSALNFAINQNE